VPRVAPLSELELELIQIGTADSSSGRSVR
jgi:hypothetical protein